ncbi:MAG: hypothetical protein HGA97_09855 [Chlorobiaceae bacterium]|nr:hypothetical protein [Chlorobiaceae bacterium]
MVISDGENTGIPGNIAMEEKQGVKLQAGFYQQRRPEAKEQFIILVLCALTGHSP